MGYEISGLGAALCTLVLGLLLAAHPSSAATRTWTGGSATSGNWSTAANWDGGVAPVAGDVLNFVDTGARKTSNTNNFPAGRTFSTINVFGGGYRLRGNSVTITNYVTAGNPAGVNQIDLDFIAAGPGVGITLRSFDSGAQLTLTGDINLNARTLTTEGPGDFIITGVISGSGGILKDNTGDLSLSGLGANTFTGTTVVSAGLLRLNRYNFVGVNQVGTVAIPGDLIIGDFVSTLIGRIVVLDRDNQIANTSTVSVYATGSLELSDESDTVGELRLRGGTVTTGAGVLNVDGGIYASQPSSVSKDSTIGGRLNLGVRGDGAQIVDVAIGAQLNITAQISGVTTTDLIKTNLGSLFLTESNIFAGDVEIKDGSVTITDGHALGTTNGVTRLMGGRLNLGPLTSFGIPESLEVVGPDVSENVVRLSSGNGASWLGNVRLDRNLQFDVITNAALTVVGQISGPAGWMKFGPGTLQFKTAYTNDYEGQSQVNHGTFIMDGIFSQPVVPGHLFIAPIVNGTARASAIKHNQIADTASVSIFENGRLDLFGVNDTIGALSLLHGGTVETGSGTLTVNGSIRSERQLSAAEPSSIHGQLSLGGSQRTIHAFDSPHTVNLLISAVISDGGAAAGFNKEGAGGVQLTGANTFSGPASVTDGTLILSHPDALGSPAAGTTVSGTNGAKIRFDGGVGLTIAAEPLTLNSTGPGFPVALENFTGINQWNGPITLLAPENTVSVLSIPRTLALGGAISGPGGLRKVGVGILTLNGTTTNTFAGLTTVADGDLILDKPTSEAINASTLVIGDGVGLPNTDRVIVRGLGDEINNGTRVMINGSGQLILDGFLDLVGSIEGGGNIHFANPTSGLIVGRNNLSTTFDGVISGAGGFEKVGAGTLILNGTHTYTGSSGATEGTLVVNGSIASSLHVQLNRPLIVVTNAPFGVLAGNGSVPTIFPYPGGTVSPGTSPGRLTVAGNADFTGSDLRIEINGTTPIAQYDQLRANGNVILNNTRLFFTVGFPPTTNDTFLILEKTTPGPISGFFLNTTEGSVMGTGFNKYRITYQGGDGNDVVLRRVEIPGSSITGVAPVTPEKMQITGQGVPFVTYILEATPHLNTPIPWVPIATNSANALGIYEFIDAYADGGMNLYPARFYRVQSP
jgi:autotransporter-associated beta strand protein